MPRRRKRRPRGGRRKRPWGFEREPGDEPPAVGGGPETLGEPAEDSVEELYRLARLITEDMMRA